MPIQVSIFNVKTKARRDKVLFDDTNITGIVMAQINKEQKKELLKEIVLTEYC